MATPTVEPVATNSKSDQLVPDAAGPVAREHESTSVRVSGQVLSSPRERVTKGLIGAALSSAEAEWLDRKGFPSSSMKSHEAYKGLDLGKLDELAKNGDSNAAIEAASRLYLQAQKSLADSIDGDIDQMSDSEKLQRMALYAESEEMKRSRYYLWEAVVRGSPYAAERMLSSYIGPEGRCYKPVSCDAWVLVAWRMGDWGVQPVPNVNFTGLSFGQGSLRSAVHMANSLWSKINLDRAKLGLSPLQLDLRPSFKEWQALHQNPQDEVTIYRR